MMGESLGGYTAVTYCLPDQKDQATDVDGIYLQCPLFSVSPESNRHPVIVTVAKVLCFFMGRFPLPATKLVSTRDEKIQEAYDTDPRTYHGGLRIATGFALLEGLQAIQAQASQFDTPFRIIHGDADRVCSHLGSIAFVEQAASVDKGVKILPGREHILFKIGENEEEDGPRQEVFNDRDAWLLERIK
ncbi:hypothetical protein FRB93_010177 [Tulasnella sp. JGI-2019a]|nr:hypothetical protein FRB93_010177 [Tulasnella sp. JGI-2019a]